LSLALYEEVAKKASPGFEDHRRQWKAQGIWGWVYPIKPKWWLLASVFWGFGSQMVAYGG